MHDRQQLNVRADSHEVLTVQECFDALGLSRPELRMGDVRLGQLGDGLHDHHGRLPDLLLESRLRRIRAAEVASRWLAIATTIGMVIIAVLSPLLGAFADFTAARSGCSASSWCSAWPRSPRCSSSTPATGSWPRCSSSWPTSAPTAASSFTTPSCRTSPATTRSTASRPPATRWDIWAAGSCSRSTLPGSMQAGLVRPSRRGESQRPQATLARAPGVPVGGGLVARLLDPPVSPRAGAARPFTQVDELRGKSPSEPCWLA